MQHRQFGLLGMGVLFSSAILASVMAGCQAESSSSGPGGPGGTGGSGAGTTSTSTSDGGGTPGTGGTGNVGGGNEGGGGGTTQPDPPDATIQDIASGVIPAGVDVTVRGAVAMSWKFLVSKGSSGSCLWGIFLSAPGLTETAAYSGILALSYGTNAVTNEQGQDYCPILGQAPAGDAFPDDVAPGDVLDVVGESDSFLLTTCATQPPGNNPSQIPQRQLAKVSKVTVVGTATVPEPHLLSAEDQAKLSSPTDAAFHNMWAGVKVQIQDVTRVPAPSGGTYLYVGLGAGIPSLEVTRKAWYRPLTTDVCHKDAMFSETQAFDSIEGFSAIDFCSWKLFPADKCADFVPPSTDCGTTTTCNP
ncbi:hypothetical protein [Chondromyces apiculatus]|uniref:Uncharacterized protein n=1 Tax=Chondromyces apiculatus DSM 436 TaxID=1192034 RepID=A0A017T4R3_9BACT|nr:hypothetical protein [Chondromyces apiculatus]EYF03531.1 Hypothetical protein CAP_5515 [Chondromyces apiculatus DSM 436]